MIDSTIEQIQLLKQNGSRILGYCRVSNQKADHQRSLDNMVFDLEYAGCDLVLSEIVSGFLNRKREKYDLARSLIRKGQYQVFVIPRIDRLGRRFIKSIEFEKEIRELNCKFFVLDFGWVEVNSPQGWYDFNQACIAAEFESRKTSYRIKRGKIGKKRKQQPNAGRPMFGYRWNRDKTSFELDIGNTYEKMKLLVELYIQNEGNQLKTCKDYIEATGENVSVNALKYRIKSPTLRGHTIYKADGREEIIYNTHESIISPEQDKIISRYIKTIKANGRHSSVKPHPLRGLCFCHHCRSKMYRDSAKTHTYIRHTSSNLSCENRRCFPYQDIVKKVNIELSRLAEDLTKAAYTEDEIGCNPQIEEKSKQLAQLITTRQNTGLSTLDPIIDNLKNEINALRLSIDETNTVIDDLTSKVSYFSDPSFWDGMPDDTLRGIYVDVIERIIIDSQGNITLNLLV